MRDSSDINLLLISSISLSESPSNLRTSLGVVFEALIKPHPLSKFILSPSIVIFSPFSEQSLAKLSTISNFVSSETRIFSSGVENDFGSTAIKSEIDLSELLIISIALAPEYGPSSNPCHLSLKKILSSSLLLNLVRSLLPG